MGKQLNELETASVLVQNRTEPVRLEMETEGGPEEAREDACAVVNSVVMYTDRIETVTKRLLQVCSELEV